MTNRDFERTFRCGAWLVDKLSGDHDLLRAYMGGSSRPTQMNALRQIEREAVENGWTRDDVEQALQRIAKT